MARHKRMTSTLDASGEPENISFKLMRRPPLRKRITDPLCGQESYTRAAVDPHVKLSYEDVKRAFDVVYQPQVNIVCNENGRENESRSPNKAMSDADSSAQQVTSKRGKSHEPAKGGNKDSLNRENSRTIEVDEDDAKSEDYVYKSPSKMTSPEKKAFA